MNWTNSPKCLRSIRSESNLYALFGPRDLAIAIYAHCVRNILQAVNSHDLRCCGPTADSPMFHAIHRVTYGKYRVTRHLKRNSRTKCKTELWSGAIWILQLSTANFFFNSNNWNPHSQTYFMYIRAVPQHSLFPAAVNCSQTINQNNVAVYCVYLRTARSHCGQQFCVSLCVCVGVPNGEKKTKMIDLGNRSMVSSLSFEMHQSFWLRARLN